MNRCARLRAIARGGQTLASAATRELVRDNLPEYLALHDLGEHELRDLSGAERVYEVRRAERNGSVPARLGGADVSR